MMKIRIRIAVWTACLLMFAGHGNGEERRTMSRERYASYASGMTSQELASGGLTMLNHAPAAEDYCSERPEDPRRHAALATPPARNDKACFAFRAWETMVDGLWFDPPGTSSLWYKSRRYLDYLDQVLAEAPKYGVNALVMMGRGDRCEVPTFISYRKWPPLNAVYEGQGREDRELQIEQLNRLIEKAAGQGVGVYLWTHELHLPGELTQTYRNLAGKGARYCPSQPELWNFISSKYDEFFDRVPDLAGMFLVMSETQSSLLAGSPCRCNLCKQIPRDALLERLIRAVSEPLARRGKRLIVRTHSSSLEETETICTAINRLPKDLPITVMSKAIVSDFVGFQYPDDRMFTLVTDRPRFLEEVFGEYRGKTHIVCTPADFYRQRIQTAARNRVEGLVVRLEHNGYPRSNFESPNLFNIHYVSQLWQDPQADTEAIWQDWFRKRYGEQAAIRLIPAFKNTEAIWEHATNTLGVYTVSAHGNLAPLFQHGYNAWYNMDSSIFKLTKGYPEWDRLGQELLHPSDGTMTRIEAEIDQTNELADTSLKLVEDAGQFLSPTDAVELRNYFALLRHTARLFGRMKMLFFLGIQAEQADDVGRDAKIEQAQEESRAAIRIAWDIEREFGPKHWPLAPDDGRGLAFYPILGDYWTQSIVGLMLQGKITRSPGKASAAATLWHTILDLARPTHAAGRQLSEFSLDEPFESVSFEERSLILTTSDGQRLSWPVANSMTGPRLRRGQPYRIRLQNDGEKVIVDATPVQK